MPKTPNTFRQMPQNLKNEGHIETDSPLDQILVGSSAHENLGTIRGIHSSRIGVINGQIIRHGRVIASTESKE